MPSMSANPSDGHPSSHARLSLDHIGLYVHDLAHAAAQFARLGFCLTPFSQHAGASRVGEPIVPRGTANRCAMLTQGYLELLGVVDPTLETLGIDQELARYAGLHIVAFRTDDAQAEAERLAAAGFATHLALLQRQIDIDGHPATLRFVQVRVPPEALPEGRVFALQHDTPALLWREPYLAHDNTAVALDEVWIVTDDLAASTARYTRFLGVPGQAVPHGCAFVLARGTLRLCSASGVGARFGRGDWPQPCMPVAHHIKVASLARCAQCLDAQGVTYLREADGALRVAPEDACGAFLLFHA